MVTHRLLRNRTQHIVNAEEIRMALEDSGLSGCYRELAVSRGIKSLVCFMEAFKPVSGGYL